MNNLSNTQNKINKSYSGSPLDVTKFRRALDFARSERTGDVKDRLTPSDVLIAGIVADLFNKEEGCSWQTFEYLRFVYGFSSSTISSTMEKLGRLGWYSVIRYPKKGAKTEANNYIPNAEKAAAVLSELKRRQDQWHEHRKKRRFENRSASTSKIEAYGTSKIEGNRAYASGLCDRAYEFPGDTAPGILARAELDCASGDGRFDVIVQKPAQYRQSAKEAEQDWIELNRILPRTSEEAECRPDKRSDRGARVIFNRLLHSGVPSSQIVQHAESYAARQKRNGQWLAGVAGFLTNHFDPLMSEDETYPDDPANDNQEPSREPQVMRSGTHGGPVAN